MRVGALAWMVGAGWSVFGPVSIGASTVQFDDHLSTLNPQIFEGGFAFRNAGVFFGSLTDFVMGGAYGDGSGLNISTSIVDIDGGSGKSGLEGFRIENCGCDLTKK